MSSAWRKREIFCNDENIIVHDVAFDGFLSKAIPIADLGIKVNLHLLVSLVNNGIQTYTEGIFRGALICIFFICKEEEILTAEGDFGKIVGNGKASNSVLEASSVLRARLFPVASKRFSFFLRFPFSSGNCTSRSI